jgi:putative YhdH/YhfP family quinone oxidoreductase
VVSEQADGHFARQVTTRQLSDLPAHDTLIRVRYSSLNYKDALSASGHRGVTRHYPHTPGIDAAGEVVSSTNPALSAGEEVIVSGYDLGMNTPGGFGQYIRVPSAWVVKKPAGLTLHESMALGTAGFTAALCVRQLLRHEVAPDAGEVLVTGASGGVGCIAVALLSRLGYKVVAATGKAEAHDWLRQLGAHDVIARDVLRDPTGKALLKARWAGAVETVGGEFLAAVLKSTQRGGCVTCCGNVASPELHTTVYPFILRGVTLQGVDSAETKMPLRTKIWALLAGNWKLPPATLAAITRTVPLVELDPLIDDMLRGSLRGRVVVALDEL